jgi:hypothetical protein
VRPFDDSSGEMDRDSELDDATTERLLRGRTPASRLELAPLADLMADLRASADNVAVRPSAALAAILADGLSPSALTTDNGDLLVTAGSNAYGPAQRVAGLPKWRTTMFGKSWTLAPGDRAAVSWTARLRSTLGRNIAVSLGALVLLTGVAPAMANVAGADVPNPLAVALSSSGKRVVHFVTGDDGQDDSAAAECPTAAPTAEPTAEPTTEPTTEPTAEPTTEPTTEPTAEPTTEPTAEPTAEPSTPGDGDGCETETPTPTATPTPTEDADEANHGQIVSTVARCAPKGKDPLLATAGAGLRNHGSFVQVAAHGGTLTTTWGTFDLSTMSGAEAFCAAVEQARAALPDDADDKAKKAKKAKKAHKAKKVHKAKPSKGKPKKH